MKREFGLPHLIRFPILPELSEAGDGVLPAAPAWEVDINACCGWMYLPLEHMWDGISPVKVTSHA